MPDPIDWGLALPYYLAALAFGYVLGSIPFGLLLTRLAACKTSAASVRATSAQPTSFVPVTRASPPSRSPQTSSREPPPPSSACSGGPDTGILAGLGAFIGHLAPVWLKFRGGKGVATYIGVLLGLYWPAAGAFCAIWLLVAGVSRYSSLAALVASAGTPAVLAYFDQWQAHGTLRRPDRARLCPPLDEYPAPRKW